MIHFCPKEGSKNVHLLDLKENPTERNVFDKIDERGKIKMLDGGGERGKFSLI